MHRSIPRLATAATLALGVALGLAAAPARAQSLMSLGIAAGASIPTSDLGKSEQTGFNVTVALGSQPPLLPIGFRAEGSLNQFSGKSDAVAGIKFSNADLRVFSITGNVILQAPGLLLRPYAIAGVGYYNSKFDVSNVSSEGKFGWNAGVGAKFSLTGFSTYAEVRYHRANLDNGYLSYVPITFGIMF